MIIVGLTGSIGMGKSTTAKMFEQAGVPVHDSDAAVHRLYTGTAVAPVEAAFPGTVVDGIVDRDKLAKAVLGDPAALKRLESIVHPLVRAESDAFLKRNSEAGADIVVLDIPLLFESGGRERVDKVVVVTALPEIQRARVLARPNMTPEKFEAILGRQVPDTDKRALADYIIDTGEGMEAARASVDAIVADLREQAGDSAAAALR